MIDNPYSLENINTYIKNNDIGVKILNDKYLGVKSEYNFICKCGNKFNRTLDSFINAKSWYCRDCAFSIGQNNFRNKIEDVKKYFIKKGLYHYLQNIKIQQPHYYVKIKKDILVK